MPKSRFRELIDSIFETREPYNERIDSLSELKRIYVYLVGSEDGYKEFEKKVKESQPEAKKKVKDRVEWYLDTNKVWELIMEDEYLRKVVEVRRIESYEELSNRAFNFR